MAKRIWINVTEDIYESIHQTANMSNYISTMLAAHMNEYEYLPCCREIVEGKPRPKMIMVTISDGLQKKLTGRVPLAKGNEDISWEEYAKRLVLRIFMDKKLRTTSTKSESDRLKEALNNYLKVNKDEDIQEAIIYLLDLLVKKEQQNRIKRLIPEVMALTSKGVSLDELNQVIQEIKKGDIKE